MCRCKLSKPFSLLEHFNLAIVNGNIGYSKRDALQYYSQSGEAISFQTMPPPPHPLVNRSVIIIGEGLQPISHLDGWVTLNRIVMTSGRPSEPVSQRPSDHSILDRGQI